jgi:hypothetical protein
MDLGNHGYGIRSINISQNHAIRSNLIAHNDSGGVILEGISAVNHFISYNQFIDNGKFNMLFTDGANRNMRIPYINSVGSGNVVTGIGALGSMIQIYKASGGNGQTLQFVDTTYANGSGHWSKAISSIEPGIRLTALTDSAGNTSMFAPLYLPLIGTPGASPTVLSFGNRDVGDSAQSVIKIGTNEYATQITSVSSGQPAVFRIDSIKPSPVSTLMPNDTMIVYVTFKPLDYVSYADYILIHYTNGSAPVSVPITGNGSGVGNLTLSESNIDFQNVLVNTSRIDTIYLTANNGPVTLDTITLAVDNEFEFMNAISYPFILAENSSLPLIVSFLPTDTGYYYDSLIINNNGGTGPVIVTMSGRGTSIPAGVLTADHSNLTFGSLPVGGMDRAIVKLTASINQVTIDSVKVYDGTHYGVIPSQSIPFTIGLSDTLMLDVHFMPQSAGVLVDSIIIYNNSQVSTFTIRLTGQGYINQIPNAFTLKTVGTNNLTKDRTPDFAWEGRGDPDGDTLKYILEVSKTSDFATIAYRDTTGDTTQTAEATLDSLGAYYWRVTAHDGWSGVRTSDTGFFRIDAVPANLTMGTFFSTVTKQYLSVNVISNKLMANVQGKIVLRAAAGAQLDSVVKAFDLESAANKFYQTPYKLSNTGNLFITITGTDSAQNITTLNKNYTVSAIAKEQALAMGSEDNSWQITAPKRTVTGEGYLMVSVMRDETQTVQGQSVMTMAKPADGWTMIGDGLDIKGSATIREGQGFTVTMRYDETITGDLQSLYNDYDERKIGLYAERDGEWIYIGGEGRNGQAQAKVKEYGKVKMMYNPAHEFLPTKVELAQNYPNPFNPTTTIRFGVPQESKVKLVIYNVLGQKVKELVNESRSAGYYNIIWNGRSDHGHVVSSGVYLYRIETPQGAAVKKMILVK